MSTRILVAALSVLLVACSGTGVAEVPPPPDVDVDVTIEMREMTYSPQRLEIPAGDTVTVHLVNQGTLRHNLVLPDGTESPTLHVGEATTLEIGPLTERATAWCSVPGHRNAGMELDIVVGD